MKKKIFGIMNGRKFQRKRYCADWQAGSFTQVTPEVCKMLAGEEIITSDGVSVSISKD